LNVKKNFFYYVVFIFSIIGIYLSLNVGISHDEYHDSLVWSTNKNIYQNYFFNKNLNTKFADGGMGFYGIGFHIVSMPIEYLISFIFPKYDITELGKLLVTKHASVFIFFIISSIYFKKIIYIITKNNFYSKISTLLFLTYPYLLGHSFFNIKDIPFMSVWLICTYYIIYIIKDLYKKNIIKNKNILILSILTAYLLSIRISGILIFVEYLIFAIILFNISNLHFTKFVKYFYKQIIFFTFLTLIIFYLLHPNYWKDPFKVIDAIQYMSQHIQTACTVTLGECMKAQNLPSTYLPIWFFFKLPVIILLGLILFPFVEKKIFNNKENILVIGSLLISVFFVILILILFKVNLYDELRQVLFLIPLFFITSLTFLFFFSKKISIGIITLFIIFFTIQNIKIYPYNYVWLNNFSSFTSVNKSFELDYWGISSKKIAEYFNNNNVDLKNCIISNRNDGIEAFIQQDKSCFISFKNLHKKNIRPFHVVLMERGKNKGLPNNCNSIHEEKININFSNEDLILARVFKCN
tara:strand:+ start:4008 stop:5576 length:1569 start_codon:yes stop_codon:yes gene_type:complete